MTLFKWCRYQKANLKFENLVIFNVAPVSEITAANRIRICEKVLRECKFLFSHFSLGGQNTFFLVKFVYLTKTFKWMCHPFTDPDVYKCMAQMAAILDLWRHTWLTAQFEGKRPELQYYVAYNKAITHNHTFHYLFTTNPTEVWPNRIVKFAPRLNLWNSLLEDKWKVWVKLL